MGKEGSNVVGDICVQEQEHVRLVMAKAKYFPKKTVKKNKD